MFLTLTQQADLLAAATKACGSFLETRSHLADVVCPLPVPASTERAKMFHWVKGAEPIEVGHGCWLVTSIHHLAMDPALRLVAQHIRLLYPTRPRADPLAFDLAVLVCAVDEPAEIKRAFGGVIAAAKNRGSIIPASFFGEECAEEIQVLLLALCAKLDPQFPVLHRLVQCHTHAFREVRLQEDTGYSLAYGLDSDGHVQKARVPEVPPPMISVRLLEMRPSFDPQAIPVHTQAGVFMYRLSHMCLSTKAHMACVDVVHGVSLDNNSEHAFTVPALGMGHTKPEPNLAADNQPRWSLLGLVLQQ